VEVSERGMVPGVHEEQPTGEDLEPGLETAVAVVRLSEGIFVGCEGWSW
jgi:hypothetical protein